MKEVPQIIEGVRLGVELGSLAVPILMAFRKQTREFWLKAANYKCQYEFYDAQRGWRQCNAPAKHVHHIRGEAETLEAGDDPNDNVGLALCQNHHVLNTSGEEHSYDFSFHPDIGEAYTDYQEWKRQAEHMASITGKAIDYSTSPFAEVGKRHQEMVKDGERYIAGDENIDEYYNDKMRVKASMYATESGEVKPQAKEHLKTDKSKKKHWWDGI